VNEYYLSKIASEPTTLGFVLPEVAHKFEEMQCGKVDKKISPPTLILNCGYDEKTRSDLVRATLKQFWQNKTFEV
jgi:hypothetical protein